MSNKLRPGLRGSLTLWLFVAAVVASGGLGYAVISLTPASDPPLRPEPAETSAEAVHQLCGACHAYPPPDTFPRSAWRHEVKQGYDFFHKDPSRRFDFPPLEAVVRYYEGRAPEELPPQQRTGAPDPTPVRFERRGFRAPGDAKPPGMTHVSVVRLFRKDKPDVLVCDAISNQVLVLSPYESPPVWRVIARDLCCAHAEVVDLDADGIKDVLLACLGSFYATDQRVGSVVCLKGATDGSFTPVTLLDGLGRVADVRAADFTGNGKLDLVVAEFGWLETGQILLLENQTTDQGRPAFAPRVLDPRHGTTHVPVSDLNGDGKPDFVAVISQEHETVVAFLNEGGGRFRPETIYTAPHPAYGCNGVQLIDLDGDGDLDMLLTNGDTLDFPFLLKPYHGLTWLENRGGFPFTPHRLADCYGAGSPVAADFDGNGLTDIAFATFLPGDFFPQRAARQLDAVVLLEQVAAGKFVRHALEVESCDHLTSATGDLDGDGRPDLVIGNFLRNGRASDSLTIWRNTTERRVGALRSRGLLPSTP